MLHTIALSLFLWFTPPAERMMPAFRTLTNEVLPTASFDQAKAVIIVFLGTECPVSNSYAEELNRLAEIAAKQQVLFVGIYPEPDLKIAHAIKHHQEFQLQFPVMHDPKQTWVQYLNAKIMPEVFVLSSKKEILYHGRIDDRYAELGKRRIEAKNRDLFKVLEELTKATPEYPKSQKSIGCPIPKPD